MFCEIGRCIMVQLQGLNEVQQDGVNFEVERMNEKSLVKFVEIGSN